MVKKYMIFDLRKGLLSEVNKTSATSPKEALIKAGYINIERVYDSQANVVVKSSRGSYLFKAELPKECGTCKHEAKSSRDEPCVRCKHSYLNRWERKYE